MRHHLTRRGFLRHSAGLTAAAAGFTVLATGAGLAAPGAQAAPTAPAPTTSPTPTNTPTPSSAPNRTTAPDGPSTQAGPNRQGGTPATSNADRAVAAYNAMQKYFATDHNLYHETFPSQGNPYSYHWPFSQAMAGTLDMMGLPRAGSSYQGDVQKRLTGLAYYWDGQANPPGYDSYVLSPLGQGGDKYYDDNDWTGLNSIQLYRMNGDSSALDRAKKVFDLAVSGWGANASPDPGGVYWVQASWNRDRGTVSNATGAEVGLHLYLLTGKTNSTTSTGRTARPVQPRPPGPGAEQVFYTLHERPGGA